MPLTVLSIAFPFAPVGPGAVGGSEQVLSNLDEALIVAGHRSLVAACEGSETAGELFAAPLPTSNVLDDEIRRSCRRRFQEAINRALASHDLDLIHMHGMDFDQYSVPDNIPRIVTLHMPLDWYAPNVWPHSGGLAQFVCVSESQRQTCPEALRENVVVVQNGVALPESAGYRRKEDFALALGRICPEKNVHEALQAGTLAATRVLLGGQVFPYEEHQRYFEENVRPVLGRSSNGIRHEFLGPLDPERRQELLARARCLLHPTLAPETSSLVAMEALAAGTPVIAYRSGALPEIVDDGVTGFLVDDVQQMAQAIHCVDAISSEACRAAAERRFSRETMIRGYFDLYQSLMQRRETEAVYA